MERLRVTFCFKVGQTVRWQRLDGPRYVVRQRRYVEGDGAGRYEYLLHNGRLAGYDFWAAEGSLLRDWETCR